MAQKVRVRFAPSPTGFLHIGGLRTALYNYLFAKKHKGDFILRIEDTDRTRAVKGGIENIIKTLEWAGLKWNEGPVLKISNSKFLQPEADPPPAEISKQIPNPKSQISGKSGFGPYIQSQRLGIYQKYAQELISKGKAYRCFCTEERLKKLREEQKSRGMPPMYDGQCRPMSLRESPDVLSERPKSPYGESPEGGQSRAIKHEIVSPAARNGKKNTPYVVRLAVPEEGRTEFEDIIHGQVSFENKLIDDQVLLKSDGYPTYHLANVVDDHLMKISHVIRGDEWLPSTPKHVLLYKAFGWKPPQFAHLPLLLNKDRSKLSKRTGEVAVEEYIKQGYLPEVLINFVALLGWNPRDDQEIYTLNELIKNFDLKKVNKGGAVVNFEKLDWLNGYYLRQLSVRKLTEMCLPYLTQSGLIKTLNSKLQITNSKQIPKTKFKIPNTDEIISFKQLERIIILSQERMRRLSDVVSLSEFFFKEPRYHPKLLAWKKMGFEQVKNNLEKLIEYLPKIKDKDWQNKKLEKIIKEWIEASNLRVGETLWPMRVALSGHEASPSPFEIGEILGKEKTIKRIKYAISLLE